MKKSQLGHRACSVARTLSSIGDSWSFLIVREIFLGTRRFEEFQAQTGASPSVISQRLAHLVEEGILRRSRYQDHPPRDEFRLTRKGLDLWPVIVALMQFGDRWEQGQAAPPMRLRHLVCNHTTNPALMCDDCGEPVSALNVTAEIGKRLIADRSVMSTRFKTSVLRGGSKRRGAPRRSAGAR